MIKTEDKEGYKEYVTNNYILIKKFIKELNIDHNILHMDITGLNIDEMEKFSEYLNDEINKVEVKREEILRKYSKTFGMYQMDDANKR